MYSLTCGAEKFHSSPRFRWVNVGKVGKPMKVPCFIVVWDDGLLVLLTYCRNVQDRIAIQDCNKCTDEPNQSHTSYVVQAPSCSPMENSTALVTECHPEHLTTTSLVLERIVASHPINKLPSCRGGVKQKVKLSKSLELRSIRQFLGHLVSVVLPHLRPWGPGWVDLGSLFSKHAKRQLQF